MTDGNYDIDTLKAYLAGKLDAKAMHALEKRALDDPFLQSALDGLAANPELGQQELAAGMDRLNRRLDRRVSGESVPTSSKVGLPANALENGQDTPVLPLNSHVTNRRKWLGVAAAIVLLLAGGWFYLAMQGGNKSQDRVTDTPLQQAGREIASGATGLLNKDTAVPGGQSVGATGTQDVATATKRDPQKSKRNSSRKGTAPELLQQRRTAEKQIALNDQIVVSERRRDDVPLNIARLAAPPIMPPTLQAAEPASTSAMAEADAPVAFGNRGAAGKMNADRLGYSARLDSVAIVGYGSQRKAAVSGVVRANKLRIKGAQALVASDSTVPERSNKPLVVIDGVPARSENQMDTLDPNSIKRISVLKEAAAVARFGNQGRNGVVLITTKKSADSVFSSREKLATALRPALPETTGKPGGRHAIEDALSGHVAGIAISGTKELLSVKIRRLAGHLVPDSGLRRYKKYLEAEIDKAVLKGKLTGLDTGSIHLAVDLNQKGYIKSVPNDRLFQWFSGVIEAGPTWIADKHYKGKEVDAPTSIEIKLFHSKINGGGEVK